MDGTYFKQIIWTVLGTWLCLCVINIGNVQGGGSLLLCGRDCSTACLNNACERFLYECKYGCKSGLNDTGCPKDLPPDEEKKVDIGLIVGVTVGASVAVVLVCVCVVCVYARRRRKRQPKETENQHYENRVAYDKNEGTVYSELGSG